MFSPRRNQTSLQAPSVSFRSSVLPVALFSLTLFAPLGCKSKPAPDAALTQAINAQLSSDSSLSGQPVQANVQAGVATLTGSVLNEAQRTIAARDAAGVQGIREVVNNLSLASASATAAAPVPIPLQKPTPQTALIPTQPAASRNKKEDAYNRQPAPIQRNEPQQYQPPQQAYNPPPPPAPRPQPPIPVFKTVTIPAGSTLPVRVTQTLDSASTQQGDNFSGVIASDVLIDDVVAIPAGAAVTGNVDAVQEAGHFKGNSLLTVSLSGISFRGERLPLSSDPYTVAGKGRGKNTAEKAGGGAAVGAILGGIFGGGKGAAIGAGVGGAGGAGINAVTRGQQVQIPSETVVRFHTSSPITLHVRNGSVNNHGDSDQSLHPRSNQ